MDGVLWLPAVMPSSGTRPVSAMISTMRAGSTRSSSAAAWVISPREPCPVSTLPVITVMTPSRSMCSRAATFVGPRPKKPPPPAAPTSSTATAPLLGQGDVAGNSDQQPGAEDGDEVAARKAAGRHFRKRRLIDFGIDAMVERKFRWHDWRPCRVGPASLRAQAHDDLAE